MREKLRCRHCTAVFSDRSLDRVSAARASAGRGPFAILGSEPRYAPDLPFRLEHLTLDLSVDPEARTLEGEARLKIRAIAGGEAWLKLDQIELRIQSVRVAGAAAEFSTEGERLDIRLPQRGGKGPELGEVFEVAVRYALRDSRRGLYFTGPDADYPGKPYQAWTQGQDEDSRHWYPSFDYPNQKATSEVIARVPRGYTAVSNGALVERAEEGKRVRYHYRLGTPHVSYLVCLTVAKLSQWEDKGPGGLPVQYFVAPGREADGRRAFSHTPAMIAAFAKKIGVPYPYEKYSQVAVQDFIWGGMENTSATTQTDLTLHDERAHLDFTSDGLVSHELAHQWFGDLLTCRDWSHGWLNEGFATFMERIWIECNTGKDGGWDEAKYYSYLDLREYLAEDTSRYRRPIVCNTFAEPMDLFDAHLYQKGGLVLNLLRHLLGEEPFWRSIETYVKRHRGQNVETLDLIRAIEDTTGRNLRRVFDEWVFGAGHPELELSYLWHEDSRLAELVIEQKQTGGLKTRVEWGFTTHLFHLPAVVELTLGDGTKVRHKIQLGEARERAFVSSASKPVMVRFDPESWIPKTLKFPRPKEMLLHQLKHDADCMGRIEAARELVAIADRDCVEGLGEAVRTDRFWGVQAEAACHLGEIRTEEAREQLVRSLEALAQGHPKARRAVVGALGTFKDERSAAALRPFAAKDASYHVEADATYAWAQARLRPVPAPEPRAVQEVEDFLLAQLGKPSYREVIRAQALFGLAELPGVGRGERPRASEALISWARRGRETDARAAAIGALGRVARTAGVVERARILDVFGQLGDEESFRIRMALVPALRETGGAQASFLLWKIRRQDIDGRVRRQSQQAMEAVDAEGTPPEAIAQLRESLGKLEDEQRKLRAALEEARAGLGAKPPGGPAPVAAGPVEPLPPVTGAGPPAPVGPSGPGGRSAGKGAAGKGAAGRRAKARRR